MKPIYIEVGKLGPDQKPIYEKRLETSFIVRGCAGSGKSSLALLRMQQMLAEDRDHSIPTPFYYITYVRELVECIRKELRNLASPPVFNDYAITYENWKKKSITAWTQAFFNIQARPCMHIMGTSPFGQTPTGEIMVNPRPKYLLVDECQDLERDEIDTMMTCGAQSVVFYGDDDQHIMAFKERHPVTLETIATQYGLRIMPLIFNYRLPQEIAKFAEQISGRPDLALHCKSEYHERPFVIKVKDEDAAIAFMAKRINSYEMQDVGIAFTKNEQVRAAYHKLATEIGSSNVSANWNVNPEETCEGESVRSKRGEHWNYLSDTRIKIMTYEKIKGRQFEVVFLFVSGELTPDMIKRFYVGVTRSERFLYVLYSDAMPSILRQIPLSYYETTDTVMAERELARIDSVTTTSAIPDPGF